jgi:hypothetical protein
VRLRTYGFAAATVVAACSGGLAGPRATANIVFIAGNHQSDTILATLKQPLVIRVAIPSGQQGAGHVVQFQSFPDTNTTAGYQLYLGPDVLVVPGSPTWNDSTNNAAEASVIVTMGEHTGTAQLLIKVPDFGYVDTATFTVLPGGAYALHVSPADTTIFTAASFTYNASTVDRFGNPRRGDSLTYVVDSGPVTIAAGKATGTAPGYATVTIIAPKQSLAGNATIVVVPHGTLAASNGQGIVMFRLDGTGMRTILEGTPAGDVNWDPTGTHIVYDGSAQCFAGGATLHTTDLQGDTTLVANGGGFDGGNYDDAYPSYSDTGNWIYYSQNERAGVGTGRVLRVRPDGTGDTLLLGNLDYFPAPAPDGTRMAYVAVLNSITDLRILNLSSGVSNSLHVNAWSPEWSPAGNEIAYLTPFGCTGPIALISPDGSGSHILTTETYHAGFGWSPDGQWIAANNLTTGLIDLINASSGQTIPLLYTQGLASPAWQPGQPSMAASRRALASGRPAKS